MQKKTIVTILAVTAMLTAYSGCGKKNVENGPVFNKGATRDTIEGNTWYMKGCFHRAFESYNKAYEKFAACDDLLGMGRSLNNIGTIYRYEKDFDSALLFFNQARGIFSELGEYADLVQILSNTAAVYMDMDDLDKAGSTLDDADETARNRGVVLPTLKSNRALLLVKQKKADEAKALMDDSFLAASAGKPFEYATLAHAMGVAAEASGDPDKALDYYNKALETDKKASYSRNIAADLTAIGRVLVSQGKNEEALDILYRALSIQTLVDDAEGAEKTSAQLKACLEALGEKKPDIRVREFFMKRWSEGNVKAGICK